MDNMNQDDETTAAIINKQDEEETATKKFDIPIHSIISNLQRTHGLLQNDYSTYRQYCTRRLSRLRHVKEDVSPPLLHSASKHKHIFVSRPLIVEGQAPSHENVLLIALLQTERAWAHGMEHKQQKHSKRQHYLRKFYKAHKLAKDLEALVKQSGTAQTVVECKAYCAFIGGYFYLEKNDWVRSAIEFHKACVTCRGLAKLGNLESQDLFLTRVENVIEPLLKFCRYELMEGGMTEEQMNSLLEEESTSTTNNNEPPPPPSSKKSTQQHSYIIDFRNETIQIDNETLCIALLKIDTLLKPSKSSTSSVALAQGYDDALDILSTEIQNLLQMASGPNVDAKLHQMELLKQYLMYGKLSSFIRRNEDLVLELLQQPQPRFDEIAHVYSVLLQDARSIASLSSSNSEQQEDEFLLRAQAHITRYRALRCFYLGCCYADIHKVSEARALFELALELASRAAEELAACAVVEEELVQSMITLEKEVTAAKCRLEAQLYIRTVFGTATSTDDSNQRNKNLFDRLDDSFSTTNENTFQLVDIPPNLEYAPCKPTFFDMAWNYLGDMPEEELQNKIQEMESSQKGGGLLGWFRRG